MIFSTTALARLSLPSIVAFGDIVMCCDKEREVNKEFAIVNVGSAVWLEVVKRERTKKM